MLEAADECRRGQLGRSSQFDGVQAGYQFGEEAVHLHPRQRGAEAEVHAVAECQVLVRVAADVEPERLGEDVLISVPGNISQIDGFALGDRPPSA